MDILKVTYSKPYLLDPKVQSNDLLSIYKSVWQIFYENSTWILILVVVVITTFIFFFYIRKKNSDEPKQSIEILIDPYDEALMAIQELQGKKTQLQPKPFVFRLSESLRIYVQRRFKMPAMEVTGEEFIVEIVSNPFFSGNYEDLLREFVNLGDRVKYSKETTEESQINLLLDSAIHFLKDSHNRLKANEINENQNTNPLDD